MANANATGIPRSSGNAEEKKKSKKPSDSAFKQQRLPAWQPVMTAKTVIPVFLIIGVIFVPVGAVLFQQASLVKEKVVDYTTECGDCYDSLNTTEAHSDTYEPCTCSIQFSLEEDFQKPVYMYYGLDNFYQNHRRYVKSRDDTQLLGEVMHLESKPKLNTDCDPFRSHNDSLYAPCGAIANSLFNDTLTLAFKNNSSGSVPVPLNKKGIAWKTDKESKFKNPDDVTADKLCQSEAFKNTIKPPNWKNSLCELDLGDSENNGYQNEDLIVWMRTAALPNFRKLYRKIDHSDSTFADGLPSGDYSLDVVYNYPVKDFSGRKQMILSTVSVIGGKNPFLGIAYIVVGALCILLAAFFTIVHFKCGKRIEEVVEVNDRTPYSQN